MDGLLIGRFQPFHLGHLEALRFALSRADALRVGVGSSNRPPEPANPFSATERREMILSSVDGDMRRRISVHFIPDVDDHAAWVEQMDSLVPSFEAVFSNDPLTAGLYSRRSVRTEPIPFVNRGELSGTRIRGLIVSGGRWEHLVPEGTRGVLARCGAAGRLRSLVINKPRNHGI